VTSDTSSHSQIAAQVAAFYEAHPYPPPLTDLDTVRTQGQAEGGQRARYHLVWPHLPYCADLAVLVAGCGTSQAAVHALRYPTAQVIGIDVSAAGVRHTLALKQKYGLDNLQVHQLPLERVADLGQSFDQIVCTGVLHHLPDPLRGLGALRTVLRPHGALHLMVYATYGRTGIYMLQEYCRRLGVRPEETELLELADTLKALPREHPLTPLLQGAPDMLSAAGLADALLHPQDRAYTVPQLFAFLQAGGFEFGHWLRQAPYLPQCGAFAATPHSLRLRQLPRAEQYAALELLRGTMVRHSVIAYLHHPGRARPTVDFAGDAWLRYVPLRRSESICVEKQLPPGAAAVLINQGHTCRDLILPIDTFEKRLFDGIDGVRSIDQIARSLPQAPDRRRTRACFERLWWYDHVAFDISCTIAP
jgi:SAM-dependent methyltransferase